MTFEEFFKKKKIDLPQLQSGEPALFAEFEQHYAQMGEKSFDHTKKYWFNQLRRRFPLPPEVKVEKLVIENPLAEQTIADSLTEPAGPPASIGFKPRFKAGMATRPAEEQPATAPTPEPAEETPQTTEPPKPAVGFKPRFKASMVSKPAEEQSATAPEASEEKPETKVDEPEKPVTPALGFKPKFKAAAPPKPVAEEPAAPVEPETKVDEPATEAPPKPMGFKPRFNAAKMKPKEPGEE